MRMIIIDGVTIEFSWIKFIHSAACSDNLRRKI